MRISKAGKARRGLALAFSIAVLTGGAADAQAAGDPVDVRDAVGQFQALKHHGEALGWRLPEELGAPDPSNVDHYQGVARYPGPGAPVFYVTQKDTNDAVVPPGTAPGGYLNVVRMGGERRPTSGERIRSNLQSRLGNTDQVDPPSADTWLRSIRFDGSFKVAGQTLPAYVHPGGMAIIDDILIMALDQPQGPGPDGQLVLFDLKDDPTSPRPIRAIPLDHRIDNLAAIEEQDGSVLIWVNGDSGYVTASTRSLTFATRAPRSSSSRNGIRGPTRTSTPRSTASARTTGGRRAPTPIRARRSCARPAATCSS